MQSERLLGTVNRLVITILVWGRPAMSTSLRGATRRSETRPFRFRWAYWATVHSLRTIWPAVWRFDNGEVGLSTTQEFLLTIFQAHALTVMAEMPLVRRRTSIEPSMKPSQSARWFQACESATFCSMS